MQKKDAWLHLAKGRFWSEGEGPRVEGSNAAAGEMHKPWLLMVRLGERDGEIATLVWLRHHCPRTFKAWTMFCTNTILLPDFG